MFIRKGLFCAGYEEPICGVATGNHPLDLLN